MYENFGAQNFSMYSTFAKEVRHFQSQGVRTWTGLQCDKVGWGRLPEQ